MINKSLEQLFNEFIYEGEYIRKLRAETLRGYEGAFKLFTKIMPEVTCQTITSNTIAEFFKIIQERKRIVGKGIIKAGVKISTVATYWNKLNAFFKWLTMKRYISENPFATLRHPSPVYEDKKFLKREEIEKIITAIHTHHNNNLLILNEILCCFIFCCFAGYEKKNLCCFRSGILIWKGKY